MIPFPEGKFDIIYSDPPWSFNTWSAKGEGRSAKGHYNITPMDELKGLPVRDIASPDSVLFMWATYPNLQDAFELGEAWGFKYKTCAFSWVKQNKKSPTYFVGMGYYTRSNPEICLLFTRGNPLPRVSKSVQQLYVSPIEGHSKKPDGIRDKIVELFGNRPRIELFARQRVKNWSAWGDMLPEETK